MNKKVVELHNDRRPRRPRLLNKWGCMAGLGIVALVWVLVYLIIKSFQ